jgi:hypothetical protein
MEVADVGMAVALVFFLVAVTLNIYLSKKSAGDLKLSRLLSPADPTGATATDAAAAAAAAAPPRRFLVVTAHPDDECMFFAPTIQVPAVCVWSGPCASQGVVLTHTHTHTHRI